MRVCVMVMVMVVAGLLPVPAFAGYITSTENGGFSTGNTNNWTIEGGTWWSYVDVGGSHGGVLQGMGSGAGSYEYSAWNNALADVGRDGSIAFKINNVLASFLFGMSFLGSPTYYNTIATPNNNEYNRGYWVSFSLSYGTLSIRLGKKTEGWGNSVLDTTTSVPIGSVRDGAWHTLTMHDDGTGELSVDLDGTPILSASEGASYLPTVYPSDYTAGGLWGAWFATTTLDFYVDDLQVLPDPPKGTVVRIR